MQVEGNDLVHLKAGYVHVPITVTVLTEHPCCDSRNADLYDDYDPTYLAFSSP